MTDEREVTEQAQRMVDDNLLILLEENKDMKHDEKAAFSNQTRNEDSQPIYFRYK